MFYKDFMEVFYTRVHCFSIKSLQYLDIVDIFIKNLDNFSTKARCFRDTSHIEIFWRFLQNNKKNRDYVCSTYNNT